MCSHKSHDPECVTRVYTSGFTQIAHFMQKTSSCGSFLNWKAPYVTGNHSVGGHLHFGSHLGCASSVPFMPRILCKPSTGERGTRRMGTNMFDESTGIMLELGVVHHWGLGTSGFGKVKIKRHTSLIEDVLLRPCSSEPSCPTHRVCPSYLCYVPGCGSNETLQLCGKSFVWRHHMHGYGSQVPTSPKYVQWNPINDKCLV